jgi:hypothetical protein
MLWDLIANQLYSQRGWRAVYLPLVFWLKTCSVYVSGSVPIRSTKLISKNSMLEAIFG